MFSIQANLNTVIGDFHLDRMMRYSVFVPRLYKPCKSLGFEAGRVMPARAFCTDESQGFPIRLITRHFGAFPFNHGMVGASLQPISTRERQLFPLTRCVPWTAFIQDEKGNHKTLEQAEIIARLEEQGTDNPDQIDLEDTISKMGREKEIRIAA